MVLPTALKAATATNFTTYLNISHPVSPPTTTKFCGHWNKLSSVPPFLFTTTYYEPCQRRGRHHQNNSNAPIEIGTSSDFREGRGQQVDVGGRPLSVFRHRGELYALDHHCYHAGGPLAGGDIEDLVVSKQSHPCVVCPWHKYKISLKTGEGIYWHSDPFATPRGKHKLKSRGKKQRTHEIYEDEQLRVWVVLDLSEEVEFGSDYYASEDFQLLMKRRKR